MENQLLTDPTVQPGEHVLENALGTHYKRYTEFVHAINAHNGAVEWRYYNDGKSWLGKVLYKKKNLCWLSIWNTGFKLTFYFTEKTIHGLQELEIDTDIKETAKNNKPIGKLFPVFLLMSSKKRLQSGLKILEYKMTL